MDRKELFWIASSQKDLFKFPKKEKEEALFGLGLAQEGELYHRFKPLQGFSGASVIELKFNAREGTLQSSITRNGQTHD